MKKIGIICSLIISSFALTSCLSWADKEDSEEAQLPSIGEWAAAGNYKFKVVSIENTKKFKSKYSEYTTQNNFMCILVELKNDSKFSHNFSYYDFKVYKGETKYTSKGTEAYYYAEGKDDYPSLYLSGSIEASLGGKYYLVYETPTTSLEDEYELEYSCGEVARVKLTGGSEESNNVVPSGEVTFEQLANLASKVPAHSYTRAVVNGTASSYADGQRQSQSYTESWSWQTSSWSLTSAYPEQSGVDLNNTELNYFIDYLSDSQKEKCVPSVDPFKIVATGMSSVMYNTLIENSTYIWNDYGLIKSINMYLRNPNVSNASVTWSISVNYYSY